ncbi:MAG: hypothetical protein LBC45_04205 [Chlamydiales bacterium]|nr:hypothetical protein [Chlamydiales bacterium]
MQYRLGYKADHKAPIFRRIFHMPIGYNGSQNTVLLPCDSQIAWKMPPSFLQADLLSVEECS